MHVLLVAAIDPARHTGGAERVAALVAEGLADEHEVTLASLAEPDDRQDREDRKAKVPWQRYELPLEAPYHPARHEDASIVQEAGYQLAELYNPTAADRIAEMLDEIDPDVANVHNLQGLSLGLFDTLADHDVPTCYTLHDLKLASPALDGRPEGLKRVAKPLFGLYRAWVRRRVRHVDGFLSPSHYLAGRLEDAGVVDPHRLTITPNGVPIDVPHTDKPPAPRLLTYGALAPHKGVHTFAKAFQESSAELELTVAGKGPLAEPIQALAEEDERITYTGYLPEEELAALRADSLATVVPSRWPENCPMVVLESLAAGTPAIHTGLGGLGELAPDGERGLELPEDPAHWPGFLATLDTDRLAKMRTACRQTAERSYSLERMVEAYDQTLTSLAGRT